jgi:hypothetical protein
MKWYALFAFIAFSPVASVLAQEKSDANTTVAKEEPLELAGGKILVMKPAAWKAMPPKSSMVQYEFRVPAEGEKSARITIMSAGGPIDGNIERWVGQFEGAKKDDAKVEKKDVDQTKVYIVEIEGTFKESMGGPMAPGPTKKMENYKMLGAILELKDGGKVFIKATGPIEIIKDMKDGFVKMVDGIKNK